MTEIHGFPKLGMDSICLICSKRAMCSKKLVLSIDETESTASADYGSVDHELINIQISYKQRHTKSRCCEVTCLIETEEGGT